MDTKINPWLAVLIIGVFIGLIAGYSYFSMLGVGKGAIALHSNAQGDVLIAFADDLLIVKPDASQDTAIPAEAFNLFSFIGDFALFENGDLLVYQKSAQNFWQSLLDHTAHSSQPKQNAFLRCTLIQNQPTCRTFSDYRLKSSFKLAIDPLSQHVFVADTIQHQVVVLDLSGHVIQTVKNFKYPNQLWIDQQTLYVTDTNHHQISQFAIEQGRLSATRIDHAIIPEHTPSITHEYPIGWVRLGNYWIQLLTNHALSKGVLYALPYDFTSTKTQTALSLPASADPIALAVIDQHLVVSDFKSNRLYQFDANLQPQADFTRPYLQKYLDQLTLEQQKSIPYKWACIAIGAVLFIGLLLFMLYKEKTTAKAAVIEPEQGDSFHVSNTQGIEWVALNRTRVTLFLVIIGLPIFSVPILVKTLANLEQIPTLAYGVTGIGALIMLIVGFISLKLFERRIGRYGDYVVIRNFKNQIVAGRGSHLSYNERQIQIDGIRGFNDPNGMIYHRQQMQQWIQPLLEQGVYKSTRQMFSAQKPVDKRKQWIGIVLYCVGLGVFYYLTR